MKKIKVILLLNTDKDYIEEDREKIRGLEKKRLPDYIKYLDKMRRLGLGLGEIHKWSLEISLVLSIGDVVLLTEKEHGDHFCLVITERWLDPDANTLYCLARPSLTTSLSPPENFGNYIRYNWKEKEK